MHYTQYTTCLHAINVQVKVNIPVSETLGITCLQPGQRELHSRHGQPDQEEYSPPNHDALLSSSRPNEHAQNACDYGALILSFCFYYYPYYVSKANGGIYSQLQYDVEQ